MLKSYLVTFGTDGQISHGKFATEREVAVGTYTDDDDITDIMWILDEFSIEFDSAMGDIVIVEEDNIVAKYIP